MQDNGSMKKVCSDLLAKSLHGVYHITCYKYSITHWQ